MRFIVSHRLTTLFWLRLAAPALVCCLLSACATPSYRFPLTGDPMVDGPTAIAQGPPRDRVLWQYRTASAAMDRGLFSEAAEYLDRALDRVEGALTPDAQARKARGYFREEASKTFLGEPYERVMAYYYRGILYWMNQDLGNARACFRSAQLQDADTVDHSYASDYALLDYLEGYASLKLGDDPGQASTGQVQEQPPAGQAHPNPLPPWNPRANVLFFVEYGRGPIKYATGTYQEELRFRAGESPVRSARIRVNTTVLPAPPFDDLYYQATTRGGRVMDHILANKAVFKAGTDTMGNAALITGAIMVQNRRTDEAGLGLLAAGLLAKALSASTTPQADVRAWTDLPRFLSFAATSLPDGEHTGTIEFLDAEGRVLAHSTKSIRFSVSAQGGDTVLYVSDQSQTPQTL